MRTFKNQTAIWHWSKQSEIKYWWHAYKSSLQNCQQMQNFKICKIEIQGLFKDFQVLSSTLSLSSTFKGLEVFIPNSRISQARYEPCTQHMHCTRVWLSQCSDSFKPRRKIMKFISQLYFYNPLSDSVVLLWVMSVVLRFSHKIYRKFSVKLLVRQSKQVNAARDHRVCV